MLISSYPLPSDYLNVPFILSIYHSEAFTHRRVYTQKFLHREISTQRSFHMQKLLHTKAFTQRSLYTEKLLHTEAFTHRSFYTEKSLHRGAFTRSGKLKLAAILEEKPFAGAFGNKPSPLAPRKKPQFHDSMNMFKKA